MPEVTPKSRAPYFLQGILPVDRRRLGAEAFAGLTLAALAIPEVMGYTRIAGMPVVTGLYTLLIPLVLFGLLGSSRTRGPCTLEKPANGSTRSC